MGDVCDMCDVDRFLRSPEGQEHLEGVRRQLGRKRVRNVGFSNVIFGILMELEMDDGTVYEVLDLSLQVETLREEFAEVIEREYYEDYPERRP